MCLLKVVVCIYLLDFPFNESNDTHKKKIIKIELRLSCEYVFRGNQFRSDWEKKAIIYQTKHIHKKYKFETKILPKITIAGFFICNFFFVFFDSHCWWVLFCSFFTLSLYWGGMWMNGWGQILEKWTKATVVILPVRKHIRALVEKDPHIKVFFNTQIQWKRPKSHIFICMCNVYLRIPKTIHKSIQSDDGSVAIHVSLTKNYVISQYYSLSLTCSCSRSRSLKNSPHLNQE